MSDNTETTVTETVNNIASSLTEMATQAAAVVAEYEAELAALQERHKAERAEVDAKLSAARQTHKRLVAVTSPPKPSTRSVNMDWKPGVGTQAYECLTEAQANGKVVSNAKSQASVSKLTATGYLEKIGHRQGFRITEKGEAYLAETSS